MSVRSLPGEATWTARVVAMHQTVPGGEVEATRVEGGDGRRGRSPRVHRGPGSTDMSVFAPLVVAPQTSMSSLFLRVAALRGSGAGRRNDLVCRRAGASGVRDDQRRRTDRVREARQGADRRLDATAPGPARRARVGAAR